MLLIVILLIDVGDMLYLCISWFVSVLSVFWFSFVYGLKGVVGVLYVFVIGYVYFFDVVWVDVG